jgi:hypothetical protein
MEGYTPVKDVVLESVKYLELHNARVQSFIDDAKITKPKMDVLSYLEYHLEFQMSWIKDLKMILSRSG